MEFTSPESAIDIISVENLPLLQQRVGELSVAQRVELDKVITDIMVEADQVASRYGTTSPEAAVYDTAAIVGPCLESHTSYYDRAHASV